MPDPDGEDLGGRVLETVNLVEQIVVEPSDHRVDGVFDISEIHEPSGPRIDVAADRDFSSKRVAVHPPALVPFGDIRQVMRGFETEIFDELDRIHAESLIPGPASVLVEELLRDKSS